MKKVTVLCSSCFNWYESRPPEEVDVPDACSHCGFEAKAWHTKTLGRVMSQVEGEKHVEAVFRERNAEALKRGGCLKCDQKHLVCGKEKYINGFCTNCAMEIIAKSRA